MRRAVTDAREQWRAEMGIIMPAAEEVATAVRALPAVVTAKAWKATLETLKSDGLAGATAKQVRLAKKRLREEADGSPLAVARDRAAAAQHGHQTASRRREEAAAAAAAERMQRQREAHEKQAREEQMRRDEEARASEEREREREEVRREKERVKQLRCAYEAAVQAARKRMVPSRVQVEEMAGELAR